MITPKNRLLLHILFGIFLISFLYAYEFVQNFSDEYHSAKKELDALKVTNTEKLNLVKESTIGTKVHDDYLSINNQYQKAKKKFFDIEKQEKKFGFDNLLFFLDRLLPIIALFFYFLYNLYRSYKLERHNIGPKIIHCIFIMYAFFKLFWIFYRFQDFNKPVYYAMAIISAYLISLAVYFIDKQKTNSDKKLKQNLLRLSYFALKNAKEEKKEEMINIVKKSGR